MQGDCALVSARVVTEATRKIKWIASIVISTETIWLISDILWVDPGRSNIYNNTSKIFDFDQSSLSAIAICPITYQQQVSTIIAT